MKSAPVLLLAAISMYAQHQHASTLRSTQVELLDGLGNHSHPIKTNSPQAQKFFDQGLALVFGFNHDEAARLFGRAAELDPKSPMPHWGIALALGPNYNMPPVPEREAKAWQAIERAVKLSAAAPENERAYVEALTKRYSKDPKVDRHQLGVAYKDAMKQVMLRYPDDLDAATFYAEALMDLRPWQLWTLDGQPAEGTLEILQVLENVLKRDPNHPGANHYYIHAVEASNNPERGLPSAARLGALMPGAGHIVHMPSHIYLRLGDFKLAGDVNKSAAQVDRAYIQRSGATGVYPLMYYSHNLHFIAYVDMMQGRPDEALDFSNKLRDNVHAAVTEMPMLAQYDTFKWLVMSRFGKWSDLLNEPQPTIKDNFENAIYRYTRGLALAGLGRVQDAQAERERMGAITNRIPESEMLMINSQRSVLAIGLVDLDARISRAKQDVAAETASYRKAVDLQDRLNYMEPPEWYRPEREELGGALLRAGKYEEAEAAFRKDLEQHPRSGRSLYGLLEALKMQHKDNSAQWVQNEFAEAWKSADLQLTVPDL